MAPRNGQDQMGSSTASVRKAHIATVLIATLATVPVFWGLWGKGPWELMLGVAALVFFLATYMGWHLLDSPKLVDRQRLVEVAAIVFVLGSATWFFGRIVSLTFAYVGMLVGYWLGWVDADKARTLGRVPSRREKLPGELHVSEISLSDNENRGKEG